MNPTNAEDVFWHHTSSTSHWTRLKSKSAGADSGKSRTISKASPGSWLLKHGEHNSRNGVETLCSEPLSILLVGKQNSEKNNRGSA